MSPLGSNNNFTLARAELTRSPQKPIGSRKYQKLAGEEFEGCRYNLIGLFTVCCLVSSCCCLHPFRHKLLDKITEFKNSCIDLIGMLFGICFPDAMNRHIQQDTR